MYYLETKNVQSSQTGYTTGIQFYESGTLESAGVYHYGLQSGRANGTFGEVGLLLLWIHMGADTDDTVVTQAIHTVTFIIQQIHQNTFITMQSCGEFGTTQAMRYGGGVLPQASVVNGFKLRSTYSTGQITGGYFVE